MKKISLIFIFILLLHLCGCAFIPTSSDVSNIETLKGWSFQYNEGTNDYSVFFGLLTKSERYVSANVQVDVRIVNESDIEVYSATHDVTKDDFGYYSSQVAGEQYLANVRIRAEDIQPGSSANGKVYLTVYKDDVLRFDEVNCSALYCLPTLDVQLEASGLPSVINCKGYNGQIESKIKVESVTFTYEKEYTSQLKITVAGTKTYGTDNSTYDMIGYKIYDSKNYLVESGQIYLSGLSQGDKFKDDSIVVYDAVPGESYTIAFSEYSW